MVNCGVIPQQWVCAQGCVLDSCSAPNWHLHLQLPLDEFRSHDMHGTTSNLEPRKTRGLNVLFQSFLKKNVSHQPCKKTICDESLYRSITPS